MIVLTDVNFETEVLKSSKPVLVDFWAPWCGSCRMMEKEIEGLKGEKGPPSGEAGIKGKIKIGKLNVDENPLIALKYKIMSIPTLILFDKGKEVKRLVGVRGKEEIIKTLEH